MASLTAPSVQQFGQSGKPQCWEHLIPLGPGLAAAEYTDGHVKVEMMNRGCKSQPCSVGCAKSF